MAGGAPAIEPAGLLAVTAASKLAGFIEPPMLFFGRKKRLIDYSSCAG